jgi:integrase
MPDLTTKTARRRLKPRSSAYAQVLAEGRALAYRRRAADRPGKWMLRTAKADGTGYGFEVLGDADDAADADGKKVLSYTQALAAALGKRSADPNKMTVEAALTAWADAKCLTSSTDTARLNIRSAARRIAAAFPTRTLRTITTKEITAWAQGMAAKPGADPRARRATANREIANLKAALTRAANESGYEGPRAWEDAKKFGKAEAFGARLVVTTEEQEAAWIAAASPDLASLLDALRRTGARVGEIVLADVADLSGDRLTLTGKTGRRTIVLSPDAAKWFAAQSARRGPDEPLIPRSDGSRWPPGAHIKPAARAAAAAGLSADVTCYALRHAFISRALARGAPIAAIAKHCGTSAAMIEATYAHFVPNDLARWFG